MATGLDIVFSQMFKEQSKPRMKEEMWRAPVAEPGIWVSTLIVVLPCSVTQTTARKFKGHVLSCPTKSFLP